MNATCPECGKPKVAVYARISEDQKGERRGVQDQREDCWARAGEEGWCVCTPEADTFADNDISAYEDKHRPQYEALCEALAAGRYAVLVARDDGRLNREVRRAADFTKLVEAKKVAVVLLWTERWDLSTAAGRKRVRDSASDAQYEAERTGERVARARLRDAKKGRPAPGGYRRPWGFDADRLTAIPEEVEQIRDVGRRLIDGESLRSVSFRYGKNPKDVKRALLTPRMIGKRAYHSDATAKTVRCTGRLDCPGCVLFDAAWPPILERGTWEGVRALLTARDRDRVNGVAARTYLLTGFLFCGALIDGQPCDATCYGWKRQDGHLRYVCHPKGHVVRAVGKLDDHVRDEVLARADVAPARVEVDPALKGAVIGLEGQIADLDEFYVTAGPTPLPAAIYAKQRAALEEQLLDARDALAEAETAAAPTDRIVYGAMTPLPDGDALVEFFEGEPALRRQWWDEADLRRRRLLIAEHVDRIILHKGGGGGRFNPKSVEILWKAHGALEGEA